MQPQAGDVGQSQQSLPKNPPKSCAGSTSLTAFNCQNGATLHVHLPETPHLTHSRSPKAWGHPQTSSPLSYPKTPHIQKALPPFQQVASQPEHEAPPILSLASQDKQICLLVFALLFHTGIPAGCCRCVSLCLACPDNIELLRLQHQCLPTRAACACSAWRKWRGSPR